MKSSRSPETVAPVLKLRLTASSSVLLNFGIKTLEATPPLKHSFLSLYVMLRRSRLQAQCESSQEARRRGPLAQPSFPMTPEDLKKEEGSLTFLYLEVGLHQAALTAASTCGAGDSHAADLSDQALGCGHVCSAAVDSTQLRRESSPPPAQRQLSDNSDKRACRMLTRRSVEAGTKSSCSLPCVLTRCSR